MAEIALRTSERKLERAWRPVGSTDVCISDSCRRRKWLEIFCEFARPKKRNTDPKFKSIPGWNRICEAWTPELWQAWFEADRSTEEHKVGRLLMDKAYPQEVWGNLIEPIGVLVDFPLAPESDKKAHDTWLWNEAERKRFFIIVNDDADDEEVESWQSAQTRDGDLGIVLPELSRELFKYKPVIGFYNLIETDKGNYWFEVYDPAINVVSIWKKRFDYIADPEISGATMADIANPDKVLHPRFDKPISSTQMKQPKIADFKRIDL